MSGHKAPVVRREALVLLPAVGGSRLCYCLPYAGFNSERACSPYVLLAVGELFVRTRSTGSQAQNACVIARRRWASIRPKAEGFARPRLFVRARSERSQARSERSQARSACVIARRRRVSPAERCARRMEALCPGAKRP